MHRGCPDSSIDEFVCGMRSRELDAFRSAGGRWTRAIVVRSGTGVRAVGVAGGGDLQLVCDSGPYSLDAVLQDRPPDGWSVLGQVFLWDGRPASRLDVVLHRDDEPGESSRTDDHGEFAFETGRSRRLGVSLHGTELVCIELWREGD